MTLKKWQCRARSKHSSATQSVFRSRNFPTRPGRTCTSQLKYDTRNAIVTSSINTYARRPSSASWSRTRLAARSTRSKCHSPVMAASSMRRLTAAQSRASLSSKTRRDLCNLLAAFRPREVQTAEYSCPALKSLSTTASTYFIYEEDCQRCVLEY